MATDNRTLVLLATVRDLPKLWRESRRAYPPGAARSWSRRWRMVLSALREPMAHRTLAESFAEPTLAGVIARHPQLWRKVHQPFLRRGVPVLERARLVTGHYRRLRAAFGDPLLRAIAGGQDWPLLRIPLPDGHGELSVTLGKQRRFEREGELTLSLIDPFGTLLYSACATLGEHEGEPAVFIGSLNGTAPREVLRHLTKLSHGLRPASLMLLLLQWMAAQAGADRLLAVGKEHHAYWGHPRHAEIQFDYDNFWREEGGQLLSDGWWRLPLEPRRRVAADIPSQKRSMYQRRYLWLDEVKRGLNWPMPGA